MRLRVVFFLCVYIEKMELLSLDNYYFLISRIVQQYVPRRTKRHIKTVRISSLASSIMGQTFLLDDNKVRPHELTFHS